jgi:hypothetical protein
MNQSLFRAVVGWVLIFESDLRDLLNGTCMLEFYFERECSALVKHKQLADKPSTIDR